MKTETILLVIGAVGLVKKGLQQHTEKKSLGQSPHHSVTKNDFIRNRPHIMEGPVLKAKLISTAVPEDYGLDPTLQEYTAD